jgi:hypothetical protein
MELNVSGGGLASCPEQSLGRHLSGAATRCGPTPRATTNHLATGRDRHRQHDSVASTKKG